MLYDDLTIDGTVERIRKLAGFLHALPHNKKLNMSNWASHARIGITENLCKTSACVAGWATRVWPKELILQDDSVVLKESLESDWTVHGPEALGVVLGITYEQSEAICYSRQSTPKRKARELRKVAALFKKRGNIHNVSIPEIKEIMGRLS